LKINYIIKLSFFVVFLYQSKNVRSQAINDIPEIYATTIKNIECQQQLNESIYIKDKVTYYNKYKSSLSNWIVNDYTTINYKTLYQNIEERKEMILFNSCYSQCMDARMDALWNCWLTGGDSACEASANNNYHDCITQCGELPYLEREAKL
jgi:hypothetical protein